MFTSAPNLTPKGQAFVSSLIVAMTGVVLSSLGDQFLGMYPANVGDAQWRFSAAGSLIAGTTVISIELVVLVGLAALSRSVNTIKWVSTFALFLAVVVGLLIPFFLLDFVQVRRQIVTDRRVGYDLAAIKTTVFGLVTFVLLGVAGWRGLGAARGTDRNAPRSKGDGLVIGQ